MRKILTTISVLMMFAAGPGFAHQGHDHDAPKGLVAPMGGQVKALEESIVEVVSKGSDLQIYIYDKDLKPQALAGYKVKATAELPRNKKQEAIDLRIKDTHFEGSFDAKGAHRFTLILSVVDPKTGHDDKLKFVIEPRK